MAKEKRKTNARWRAYGISGQTLTRKRSSCPKCGPGIFLANHKARLYCGTCHYTEFVKSNK